MYLYLYYTYIYIQMYVCMYMYMYTCTCMSCMYSMSWIHIYRCISIQSPSRHHLARCQRRRWQCQRLEFLVHWECRGFTRNPIPPPLNTTMFASNALEEWMHFWRIPLTLGRKNRVFFFGGKKNRDFDETGNGNYSLGTIIERTTSSRRGPNFFSSTRRCRPHSCQQTCELKFKIVFLQAKANVPSPFKQYKKLGNASNLVQYHF